ncbi:MAG: hypothetical protein QM529_07025 [Hydrotalea sp.]|nr:hypothetical protein [Hydrotalea sp.]
MSRKIVKTDSPHIMPEEKKIPSPTAPSVASSTPGQESKPKPGDSHKNNNQHRPGAPRPNKKFRNNNGKGHSGKHGDKHKGKNPNKNPMQNHGKISGKPTIGPTPPAPLPQTIPVGGRSRYLALKSLERTVLQKKPFQLQVGNNNYTPQELAEANRICQHFFRHHAALEICANQLLSKPLRPADKKFSLLVHWLLVEMILFKEAPHAVSVISRFLSGVLGERARANVLHALIKRIEREATTLPTDNIPPPPIIKNHGEVYGAAAVRMMQQLYDAPAPVDLLFADEKNAADFLNKKDDGIEKIALPFANMVRLAAGAENTLQLSTLPVIADGAAWVQDISASLPARLLRVEKNIDIADLCSAPGGKARQMAALGAKITVVESSGERLLLLQKNLQSVEAQIKILMGDVLTMNPPKKFSRVLLDAPCSGTGTLRKNPDITVVKNEKDIQQAARQQLAMLHKAWDWLASGGVLVYAVCSLEREEGESVIAQFLQKERTAKILPIEKTEDSLSSLPDSLPDDAFQHGFLRLLPHYLFGIGGMDGFFIARLQKL